MKKIFKFKDDMSPRDSKRKIKKQRRRQAPNLKQEITDKYRRSGSFDLNYRDSF